VIMTAPGTIMMSKILEPETEVPESLGGVKVDIPRTDVNVLDAAARGTGEGLQLMLNVIAMLISFIALIALVNGLFGLIHGIAFTLPFVGWHIDFSWFPLRCRPCSAGSSARSPGSWASPGTTAVTIGGLLGERMVINESSPMRTSAPQGQPRSGVVHDRHVRAVWVRELELGRDPDRRHRRPRSRAQARPGAARLPRHDRGTLANFLSATLAGILL